MKSRVTRYLQFEHANFGKGYKHPFMRLAINICGCGGSTLVAVRRRLRNLNPKPLSNSHDQTELLFQNDVFCRTMDSGPISGSPHLLAFLFLTILKKGLLKKGFHF